MNFIKPKKSLGQHFLTDKNIARKIVDNLSYNSSKIVVEVGPGKGILTQYLINKKDIFLYLIEIDFDCVEVLKKQFPELNRNIFHADFLKYDLLSLKDKFSVIGNFPYNISSQILFKILENRHLVTEVVCMLQKEVADRICSKPGNKEYGILSVLLQAYFNISYLFTVNPGVFQPPPNVKSAVIKLERNDNIKLECDEEKFFKIVKLAFNQRRKMLRNSLQSILSEKLEEPLLTSRPEQLNYSQFIYLTNLITQSYV